MNDWLPPGLRDMPPGLYKNLEESVARVMWASQDTPGLMYWNELKHPTKRRWLTKANHLLTFMAYDGYEISASDCCEEGCSYWTSWACSCGKLELRNDALTDTPVCAKAD